ncbi:two-component regulator propeller domain-containing protein [Kangiella sp. HZ709]|uniref:two-component regulator propeller domain-containing protein n=1 Tax=Kangiella sp. HZ709 TaxID=2666328 RepID=UPI0012AF4C1E|nr:two-component regulator propeller domain-containing protein [Kangiella sp. HZ709]MRX26752.1 diguanylate cyclase [Kangiella sp. HZ709]
MRLRITNHHFQQSIQTIKQLVLIFAFALIFLSSSPGFSKNLPSQNVKFERITTADGLSHSSVSDIIQDDLGFMWFATQYGLNRFDGKKFDYFYDDGSNNSLSSNHINRLYKDNSDLIWVHTAYGLDTVNQKTLRVDNWSYSIMEELVKQGVVDNKTKGNISDFLVQDHFVYLLINFKLVIKVNIINKSIAFIDFDERNSKEFSNLLAVNNNYLILGSYSCFSFVSLDSLSIEKEHCLEEKLFLSRSSGALVKSNVLYLTTDEGYLTLDLNSLASELFKVKDSKSGKHIAVTKLEEISHGYWLATSLGLKFFDKSTRIITQEYYHDSLDDFSISNNDILSLYLSREGALWIATGFGISVLKPKQSFSHLLRKNEIEIFKHSNLSTNIAEDSMGNLWIGTLSSGLYKYSHNRAVLENFTKLDSKQDTTFPEFISKILEDNEKNLWILSDSGLSFKTLLGSSFRTINVLKVNDKRYSTSNFLDLIKDRYNNLWAGSSEGLFKLTPPLLDEASRKSFGKNTVVNYEDQLPPNFLSGDYGIYVLFEDLQGYIWAGGSNGLIRLDPSSLLVDHYVHEESNSSSLSGSDINTIYEDSNGVLWIGTTKGLNRVYYDNNGKIRFKRIGVKDGFATNYISAIQEDSEGYLWISTIKGITRYHPGKSNKVVNYYREQGLQDNEFFAKSSYKDKSGNLYFGGVNGITVFNPKDMAVTSNVQPISFSGITQGREKLLFDTAGEVKLINNEPVRIRISNFDYLNNRKLLLRYRLSGSSNWITVEQADIILNRVDEKTSLKVQQLSPSGVWIEPGIDLIIKPKLSLLSYHILWPIILGLMLVGLVVWMYWLYSSLNRQGNEKNLLLKREKAKQSLLMEEKLSLLHQVEDLHYSLSEQRYQVDKMESEITQSKVKDELTGLFSRGYILKNIQSEISNIDLTWADNNEKGIYLGFFCLEVDNFNSLREQYGHIAANQVLVQVAESIINICYGSDIIARWQGASMLILSRGISKREQMVLAERIRNIIASRKFDLANGTTIDITISLGFGRYPFVKTKNNEQGINWSKLIFLAETALASAQKNSLNAWIGIYSNQFTDLDAVDNDLLNKLPELINSGQLDYVSSIPKSIKVEWN